MPVQTVTTRNDGRHVALCSCGWESEPQSVKSEAYRAREHHKRDAHEEVSQR